MLGKHELPEPEHQGWLAAWPAKPMTTQSTVRWRFTFTQSRRPGA